MNAPIRKLGLVIAFLFTSLLVSTTIIQGFQAQSINARSDNRRAGHGRITDRGGGHRTLLPWRPHESGAVSYWVSSPTSASMAWVAAMESRSDRSIAGGSSDSSVGSPSGAATPSTSGYSQVCRAKNSCAFSPVR